MRDFVAIASHDLRTPITVIKGFAAMLDDNGLDESGLAEIRGTIVRQADHLGDIVDDLLMSSRLEAGALTAQRELLEVAGVAREVAADLGFEVAISVPAGLCCCADPDHLRRMLANYLQNARNYGQPPFSVRACDAGNEVEVRVCDRGPGLPAEFVPRAFEKFARAADPHSKQRKGTGLGLAIVRGLARLEGGDAWYEPNEPCGACFAISLPNQDNHSSMRRGSQ